MIHNHSDEGKTVKSDKFFGIRLNNGVLLAYPQAVSESIAADVKIGLGVVIECRDFNVFLNNDDAFAYGMKLVEYSNLNREQLSKLNDKPEPESAD